MPHRRRRSSAFALVFVLVCMTVVIISLLAMVQRVTMSHRMGLQRERQIQARWLVEAGLDRAAARLRTQSTYEGESWQPQVDGIGGRGPAKVDIVVEATEVTNQLRVHVTAFYPDQDGLRIRAEQVVYVHSKDQNKAQTQ